MRISILKLQLFALLIMGVYPVLAQYPGRYRTVRLQKIAQNLECEDILKNYESGVYLNFMYFQDCPLTAILRNQQVEHIGYTLFSERQRQILPSPIYNFLERYSLEMDLPREETFTIEERMQMDMVTFRKGDFSLLKTIAKDSTLAVTIILHDEKRYSVTWKRGDELVCHLLFPASYTLLHGSAMIENENRLQQDILSCDTNLSISESIGYKDLQRTDSLHKNLYILDGGYNSIPSMKNIRYYISENDSMGHETFTLLYSMNYPIESMTNLFVSNEIENGFFVDVKLRKYNFEKEYFTVPLTQFLNFFRDENCVPYIGVLSYETSNNKIVMVLEMRNVEMSYEHLMKIEMKLSDLENRKGVINVTMTSYIPTHNVKNLYND